MTLFLLILALVGSAFIYWCVKPEWADFWVLSGIWWSVLLLGYWVSTVV